MYREHENELRIPVGADERWRFAGARTRWRDFSLPRFAKAKREEKAGLLGYSRNDGRMWRLKKMEANGCATNL